MRRRMLSGVMMVWPAALAVAGVTEADYALEDGARVRFGAADLVPALPLYPVSDTGALAAGQDPFPGPDAALVDGVWRVRLSDMKAITRDRTEAVASQIAAQPEPAIVDLRGNPGGDFTKALPLIDALARGPRCAVLVDAYTFSAAIVVAVLIAHRLGPRAALFGGDMGDDLRFWAEGDMEALPETGAALRYATAWHDWRDGQADATTPGTIARHLVAAGDVPVRPTPMAEIEAAALEFVHGW